MVTKIRDATEEKDDNLNLTPQDNCINPYGPLDAELPVSAALLSKNLYLFIALKTIGSFDSGAFSAALGAENGIAEEWGLTTVQQGTLTSSVFLGNILGCLLSGHLFSRYSAKMVLVWSLIFHTIFTFLFATLTEYNIALLCRFLIGITLSFVIVYTPMWVDEYAPRDRQSVWMASHNAGVPLGIMLGYCFGAFLPSYTNINWEWAFYAKCVFTIPTVGYLMRLDRRSIDRRHMNRYDIAPNNSTTTSNITNISTTTTTTTTTTTRIQSNRAAERIFDVLRSNVLYLWSTCAPLFHNLEYMCSMLAMCSLYFVVTGLQNFVTQYLRDEPFNASMKVIMIGFGGAVVTAPVFGVITGGILLDRIGGYQRNLKRVTSFTCAWGAAAASFSIICIFITDTMMFLCIISIVLFCGGAIIPPGSGTVMTSVPERLRPAGAAFSQMMYNLLGNFSGPMVCGYVAHWTGELKYGIYTVLSCSVVGLLPMLVLLHKAFYTSDNNNNNNNINITSVNKSRGRRPLQQQHTQIYEEEAIVIVSHPLEIRGEMKRESPRVVLTEDDITQGEVGVIPNIINNNNNNNNNMILPEKPLQTIKTTTTRVFTRNNNNNNTCVVVVDRKSCNNTPLPSSSNITPRISENVVERSTLNNNNNNNNITTGGVSEFNFSTCSTRSGSAQPLPFVVPADYLVESCTTTDRFEEERDEEAMSNNNNNNNNESSHSEDFDLELESDAAQMMSFPNQHNFGLDVLRSLLSNNSRRRSLSIRGNNSTSNNMNNNNNNNYYFNSNNNNNNNNNRLANSAMEDPPLPGIHEIQEENNNNNNNNNSITQSSGSSSVSPNSHNKDTPLS